MDDKLKLIRIINTLLFHSRHESNEYHNKLVFEMVSIANKIGYDNKITMFNHIIYVLLDLKESGNLVFMIKYKSSDDQNIRDIIDNSSINSSNYTTFDNLSKEIIDTLKKERSLI